MRVAQELLLSVAFLSTGSSDNLLHHATVFLLLHDGLVYLVTARHVVQELGDDPHYVRFNTKRGRQGLFPIDFAMQPNELFKWFHHPDPAVDIAVLPFPWDLDASGAVAVALNSTFIVSPMTDPSKVGCGDMCHVIGLFKRRAGKSRNFPVVHTGHIAAMSDANELIPLRSGKSKIDAHGYLVEVSNLSGLSGAPVFVRSGIELDVPTGQPDNTIVTCYQPDLWLLGVWVGSWENPDARSGERYPTGMGIVAPAHRLVELLNSGPVVENRKLWQEKLSAA
jgi:hypothetical protein